MSTPQSADEPGGKIAFFGGMLIFFGLVLFAFSFVAGNDADNPRCDGQRMSKTDKCVSTRSGTESYDKRASEAANASDWMLKGGIGLVVVGGVTMVVGRAKSSAA